MFHIFFIFSFFQLHLQTHPAETEVYVVKYVEHAVYVFGKVCVFFVSNRTVTKEKTLAC